MNLGERLKKIRRFYGLTQVEMSAVMGVNDRVYQRYESNKQIPGVDKISRLISHFKDINPVWLLTGEGEMFIKEEGSVQKSDTGDLEEVMNLLEEMPELVPVLKKILKGHKNAVDGIKELKKIVNELGDPPTPKTQQA